MECCGWCVLVQKKDANTVKEILLRIYYKATLKWPWEEWAVLISYILKPQINQNFPVETASTTPSVPAYRI